MADAIEQPHQLCQIKNKFNKKNKLQWNILWIYLNKEFDTNQNSLLPSFWTVIWDPV